MKMRQLLGYVDTAPAAVIAKLDVTVNNPYIIIPKGSTDDEYLCVDLGKIRVSNALVRAYFVSLRSALTNVIGSVSVVE